MLRFSRTVVFVCLVGAVLLISLGLVLITKDGKPSFTPTADLPLGMMEDVQLTAPGQHGVTVLTSAKRVVLRRDYSNFISFAGQNEIVVEGLVQRVQLPQLSRNDLSSVLRSLGNYMAVYPKGWDKVGKARYKDVRLVFTHNDKEILSLRAEKAMRKKNGQLILGPISDSSDPRLKSAKAVHFSAPHITRFLYRKLHPPKGDS